MLTWPKEYGGQALGAVESVVWSQEEAKFKTPPDRSTRSATACSGPTLMAHGTPEQKATYLRDMARGQVVWCQLFSEPAAGSDLAGLRTSAVRDGDDWVLNGQKIWSTGAHYCDFGMIVTRSDPERARSTPASPTSSSTCTRKGIEIRPIKQINGGSGFNEVFFTDVRVPDANRLGAVGDGWRVALTTLMNERVAIGAGGGAGRFRELMNLAREARRNGRPAIEDSAVRQKLADFYIRSKGLQYTGIPHADGALAGADAGARGLDRQGRRRAARAADGGLRAGAAGRDGRRRTTRRVAPQEGLWQEAYLGSPGIRIAGGTDEILRNIIAERVLRLPPEIRVDKDRPFRDIPSGSLKK